MLGKCLIDKLDFLFYVGISEAKVSFQFFFFVCLKQRKVLIEKYAYLCELQAQVCVAFSTTNLVRKYLWYYYNRCSVLNGIFSELLL